MTEARYRGQKVVVVAPDYADNVKFADEWLAIAPGHRRRAGDGDGPRDPQGVLRRPADAVLHRLHQEVHRPALPGRPRRPAADGGDLPGRQVPHRRRPARARGRGERPLQDGAPRRPDRRAGGAQRRARPPLRRRRRRQVEPRPRRRGPAADACWSRAPRPCSVELPRFDDVDGTPGSLPRDVPGPPGRRPAGHHRLRPDAGAVRRGPRRARRRLRHVVRRRDGAVHPGLAGGDHRRPRVRRRPDRPRVRAERRGVQGPLDDPDGRRHQPLVPLRHDLPRLPRADHAHRLPGRQRRRLGALRRPGEVPPGHRLGAAGVRPGLEAPAAADDPHRLLVPAHRPVPLRHVRRRHGLGQDRQRHAGRDEHRRRDRQERADGLDAVVPDLRPQPARPRRRGGRGRAGRSPSTSWTSSSRATCGSPPRTRTPRRTSRACSRSGGPTCSAPRARATSTSSSTCSAPTARCAPARRPRASGRSEVEWHDDAPEGKLDLLLTLDFRQTSTTIFSDVVLPAATWYEKHDLNTTDMHPFIHSFNPAIAPPWQTRTDWDAWQTIATKFSELAAGAARTPARTSSPCRCCTTPPTRWPTRTASSATGSTASASRSPA